MARPLPFRSPSRIGHKQGRSQSDSDYALISQPSGTPAKKSTAIDLTFPRGRGNTALDGGMMRPSRFRTALQRTARVAGLGVGAGASRGEGAEFLERTYCEIAWSLLISRAVCSWSAAS